MPMPFFQSSEADGARRGRRVGTTVVVASDSGGVAEVASPSTLTEAPSAPAGAACWPVLSGLACGAAPEGADAGCAGVSDCRSAAFGSAALASAAAFTSAAALASAAAFALVAFSSAAFSSAALASAAAFASAAFALAAFSSAAFSSAALASAAAFASASAFALAAFSSAAFSSAAFCSAAFAPPPSAPPPWPRRRACPDRLGFSRRSRPRQTDYPRRQFRRLRLGCRPPGYPLAAWSCR